uniref:Uncharacterized protein n=1 Tax=Fagus sylvatica TaxID=28930 RepID=A0A2N9F854_FAGSY
MVKLRVLNPKLYARLVVCLAADGAVPLSLNLPRLESAKSRFQNPPHGLSILHFIVGSSVLRVGWLIHTRFLGLRWTYRNLYLPVDTMLVSWQTIKPLRVNSPTSKPKLPKSLMKKNSDHHGSGPWWLQPLV